MITYKHGPVRRRTLSIVGLWFASLSVLLAGCGSSDDGAATADSPEDEPQLIVSSGSGTALAILGSVKGRFEAAMPGYQLNLVAGTGTSGGVAGAVEGIFDIAAMARPPKDGEAPADFRFVPIARSPVAIYANPSIHTDQLTSSQIQAIFAGEFTRWSDVGGPDRPIILFVRDEPDSSTVALRGGLLGDAPMNPSAQILTSQSEMVDATANTPDSIGFGSWPAVIAAGVELTAITVDGIAPLDRANPTSVLIGIGYRADRADLAQPLIDWLRSTEGASAIVSAGGVPESQTAALR